MFSVYFREYTYENDFTPYMHVFIFHCCFFLEKYGSLKPFSMESVELMNRKNKLVFFSATDHGREDGFSDQVTLINLVALNKCQFIFHGPNFCSYILNM